MRAKQVFIVLGALMLMANGANAQHRTSGQTHVRNLSRVFEQAYGYAPPQMRQFPSVERRLRVVSAAFEQQPEPRLPIGRRALSNKTIEELAGFAPVNSFVFRGAASAAGRSAHQPCAPYHRFCRPRIREKSHERFLARPRDHAPSWTNALLRLGRGRVGPARCQRSAESGSQQGDIGQAARPSGGGLADRRGSCRNFPGRRHAAAEQHCVGRPGRRGASPFTGDVRERVGACARRGTARRLQNGPAPISQTSACGVLRRVRARVRRHDFKGIKHRPPRSDG
jgi:hypothetical protein